MAEKPTSEPSKKEEPANDDNSGNWWGSWISSAKNKSAEVYSMVKKDLDEIGCAVKNEANYVFSTTSTVIGKTLKLDEPESPANVMKKSLSTFIGQVSTVLNPEPDDDEDTEVILSSGDTTMFSTYKKKLEALQRVDATFIVPAYSSEFDAWKASQESPDGIITLSSAFKRLNASPLLKAQYDKLVPDAVTHDEFWERYLFRVALLQDRLAAEARKLPLEEPLTEDPVLAHLPLDDEPIVESPKKVLPDLESDTPTDEPSDMDNVTWEDDIFTNEVELTEEQQTMLLEEYEKEITSKKVTKPTSPKDTSNNNSSTKSTSTSNPKSKQNKTTDKLNNRQTPKKKNGRQSKKNTKPDECGNNLVEDHFDDKEVKDDAASSVSDESWEKEFEIDEEKV